MAGVDPAQPNRPVSGMVDDERVGGRMRFLDTVETPGLTLDVYVQPEFEMLVCSLLPRLGLCWPVFAPIAHAHGAFEHLGLDWERQTVAVELNWLDNEAIRALNAQYRHKDAATDVLTFSLLADAPDPTPWLSLPEVALGSVYIAVPWAREAVAADSGPVLERYLLERVLHGFLHLLGQHHDTMAAYEQVVQIQTRTLDALSGPVEGMPYAQDGS